MILDENVSVAVDVPQIIECLPSMLKAPRFHPQHPCIAGHACNSSIQQIEAQDDPLLHSKFEVSLGQ